jgi:hypothetical protein
MANNWCRIKMSNQARQEVFRIKLADFLKRTGNLASRNAWIETEDVSLYVRRGRHVVCGTLLHTLDLANVTVDEVCRRQGTFKFILQTMQEMCPFDAVVVENVHNPILTEYLDRLAAEDPRWVCPDRFQDVSYAWLKE